MNRAMEQRGAGMQELGGLSAEALAQRAQQGCRASFDELALRFRPRLVQFLQRRTGRADSAEDLAQDTLARAWQHIARYRDRWRFSTWLYAIASRAAVDDRRRRRASALPRDALATMTADQPSTELERREQLDDVWEASAQLLTDTQQSVLWLRYVEEMSIREIARAMGKSSVAVRVTLFRARAILAEHIVGETSRCEPRSVGASQSPLANDLPRASRLERLATGVTPCE